jgi:hypothetical protein
MPMRKGLLLFSLVLAQPLAAAEPAAPPVAESSQAHSSVSVLVDPKLDDGRLVIKIAAQNRTSAPVPFGPASISIAKPNGEVVALIPLQRLLDDVRVAAGMKSKALPTPTAGAYAAPQMGIDATGRVDVSGYTGSSAVGGDEVIRRSNQKQPKSKASISEAQAQVQIATLRQAILQDLTVQPGQVAAAQIVSEKLKFKKGEDRTLHLRIRIASDEHGFTIEAPSG